MLDLSVIIPCYQENHKQLNHIRSELLRLGAEVIVVDDGSSDPFPYSIKHGANYGYGAALMTGIKNAFRPYIMTIDGDGQHVISEIKKMYTYWKSSDFDMIIGVRDIKGEHWYRSFGRKFLNGIAEWILGKKLPDLNSGMRIFKKDICIGYHPILCKRFSFTTSITMSMMLDGYKVDWMPIKVQNRNFGKSHVNVVKDGVVTLYYILRLGFALRTRKVRAWFRNLKFI